MKVAFWLSVAMLFPDVSNAQSSRMVWIMGAGQASCGSWLSAHSNHEAAADQFDQWVLGYISSYNDHVGDGMIGYGLDRPAITQWITNYCNSKPLSMISEAASNLIVEIKRK